MRLQWNDIAYCLNEMIGMSCHAPNLPNVTRTGARVHGRRHFCHHITQLSVFCVILFSFLFARLFFLVFACAASVVCLRAVRYY